MRKIATLIVLLTCSQVFSQVGIGTITPSETLDINGSLRVRTRTTGAVTDSVLVANTTGVVKRVNARDLVNNTFSGRTLVKGSLSTGGLISLTLLGDIFNTTRLIPFTEEFDLGNEFNSSIFTANEAGYYDIGVQLKNENFVTVDTDFGVVILKGNVAGTSYTEIARNSSVNATISIPPLTTLAITPYRQINTVVYLNAGEKIKFHLVAGLLGLSINLVGKNTESFFSIQRIR
ncbi:hypothetical protein [Flavobacterium luminosum]|uniref:C1q domain-containing protein n=1 Tax=Flavobacterium luminosum TaxID=2949086 RepID=A0ABT0TK60_9FLAO|nr:hypothetical protein [Flavobacterium sp. HXWNR70]MCL9807875.1 hypothetical protein [Flavobacterium sp. HXWNR70]